MSLAEVPLAEPFEALLEPLLQEPPMVQVSPEPQEASVPVDRPLMSALEHQELLHPEQPREVRRAQCLLWLLERRGHRWLQQGLKWLRQRHLRQ